MQKELSLDEDQFNILVQAVEAQRHQSEFPFSKIYYGLQQELVEIRDGDGFPLSFENQTDIDLMASMLENSIPYMQTNNETLGFIEELTDTLEEGDKIKLKEESDGN